MKKKLFILLLALIVPLAAACSASGTQNAAPGFVQTAAQNTAAQISVESAARVSTDNLRQMATITLNGTTASADGEGVSADGSTVTITAGGVYTLHGTLTGQIVVDAGKDDVVELVLSGVSVTSSESAAIFCKQADQTIITLTDGTRNTLTDASGYTYADSATGEPNAALFAKDDLTIRGSGSLTVYGNDQNGIASKDDLIIESGAISVQAQSHGLRGKDSVTILDGSILINAGNDGIQSDNAEDPAKGYVRIEGGTLDITAAHDGIQAQTTLIVSGGTISILAGGGYTVESYSASESDKGLKSVGTVEISGGDITVNSLDDAVHAGTTATISGGTLSLMSRDDGIHADSTVNITGGSIAILASYEGVESTVVNIADGSVSMLCTDDGINAADTSQSGQGDFMGRSGGWGDTGDSSLQVNITGGTTVINAYGDGIDSNGVITMSGGELYISGPLSSANGAIDYNGSFSMSGGVLVAAGSTGMAQTTSQDSPQPSAIVYFTQSQTAGSAYILTDASGNALVTYAPDKDFQCIVFSSPQLTSSGSYRLYQSQNGTLSGATLLYEFTISGTITSVGSSYGSNQQNWQPQQNMQPQQQRRPAMKSQGDSG